MKKIIHKLRNRPEEERRHMLHIFTFIGAVILIILWSFSLGKSLKSPEVKIKTEQDLKPFSILKDSVTNNENIKEDNSVVNTQ